MFRGSYVALCTPFKDGGVDEAALSKMVNWQIEEGTQGLLPCGSTGESWLLSVQEQARIIEICVQEAAGRVPVIPGTGVASTRMTIELSQQAQKLGASAVLVATPAYVKPTQSMLKNHYQQLHEAIDLPIIIYNNPARAGVDLTTETLAELSRLPRIVALKDASADLARPALAALQVGADFCQLSGEDATALALLAQGGHGVISVTANVAPRLCQAQQIAWQERDFETMHKIRDQLSLLHQRLYVESSPAPLKYAASLLGLCENAVRAPLMPVSQASEELIREAMVRAGLLSAIGIS